jgi:hypothetical protein
MVVGKHRYRNSQTGEIASGTDEADDRWRDVVARRSRPAGTSGAQNGIRYAFFPEKRRLLIEQGGKLTTYDTQKR